MEEESYYSGSAGSLRTRRPVDDLDPMSSVANLSDAMLVFACGLLIALVVAWNVDFSAANITEVELDQSQQVDDVETLEGELNGAGTSYVNRGTVYQDPNTGTMYLLEEGEGAGGDGAAEGAEGAAGESGE